MFEELKKWLAVLEAEMANEESNALTEAIAAIETLEAKLATANARIEELKNMSSSQELLQFEVMNDGEVRLFKSVPLFKAL